MRPLLISLMLSILVGSAGCAGNASNVVKKRASFDMDCPEHDLELHELGQCSYGVRGCGKKAAYVIKSSPDDQLCACIGPCDAVLNMDVTEE